MNDTSKVICPNCTHEFTAISEDTQRHIARLRKRNQELELAGLGHDTRLLDFLESKASYTNRWICRVSSTGRGMRLHETSAEGSYPTIREAIEAFVRAAK